MLRIITLIDTDDSKIFYFYVVFCKIKFENIKR